MTIPPVSRAGRARSAARWLTGAVLSLLLALPSALLAARAEDPGGRRGAGFRSATERVAPRPEAKKKRNGAKRMKKRSNRSGRIKRRSTSRARGRGGLPAIQRFAPEIRITASPSAPRTGQRITVSARLLAGQATGTGRYAAFHLRYDPSALAYAGHKPTGRGALLVRESSRETGALVIYRSSLGNGFDASELLVELEFDVLGPGLSSLTLRDVRLFDGRARSYDVTPHFAEVAVE